MNKLTKQLLSLFMCVLMVVESGFNAGITGYATENHSGSHISVYAVKALAKLKEDVAYQTVEFGTPKSKLELPKTIFALACDEKAEGEDLEDDEVIYVASSSETVIADNASSSETTKNASQSQINISPDFMTDEQKETVVELLSQDEKPSVKEIEKETGLKLKGYRVIDLPLVWESDTSFGGEFDPKVPGVYRFISEVKNESKYVLYDPSLPTVDVEILEEDSKAFSAVWSDEDVEITVSAPAGVFPNDSTLQVERITSENENLKIDEAVEKTLDNDKSVKQTYSYDIKVLDSDGKEVEPVTAGGKKVDVTFKSKAIMDAAQNDDQYVSVYHFKDVDKEDVEKAAKANNAEESLVDVVIDALSGLVSDKNKGEKLKKPEHMKAEEPEEAAVSEVDDISGDTDRTEKNDSAPKSDDSEKVSVDGELTVKATDFSIYTIAVYEDKTAIKGYYVTVANESDSNYSYKEGDELTIEFYTASGSEAEKIADKKLAASFVGKEEFQKFAQGVSYDPTDIEKLLESAEVASSVGVSADPQTFGLIADSEGISLIAASLTRDNVSYEVESREVTKDPIELVTHKGLYWKLKDQSFYVEQDATNLDGEIKYVLSKYGSGDVNAVVSVTDEEGNVTDTPEVVVNDDGSASFSVKASDKKFTVKSSDILYIKPDKIQDYRYRLEKGTEDSAISIKSDEATKFVFDKKIYTYTVNRPRNIKKNNNVYVPYPEDDFINYTLTGLAADEEVTVLVQDGSDIRPTAGSKGDLSFSLPATVASFSVLAKEKDVKLNSAASTDDSISTILLNTILSDSNNLSTDKVLELDFYVPELSFKWIDKNGDLPLTVTKNPKESLEDNKLHKVENLFDITADTSEYRFKNATLKIVSSDDEIEVSEISNFRYKKANVSDQPENGYPITGDAELTLHYTKFYYYPVTIKTENVSKNINVSILISNADTDSITEAYGPDTDKNGNPKQKTITKGKFKISVNNNNNIYEILLKSDSEQLSILIDSDKSTTFQQHAGVGDNAVALIKKSENSQNDENIFYLLDRDKNNIAVTKLWEDGGRSLKEKVELLHTKEEIEAEKKITGSENVAYNNLLRKHFSLEYYIDADVTVGDKNVGKQWLPLDAAAMTQVLGYYKKETTVPSPINAEYEYKNPTQYVYYFQDKLYSKYIYRDSKGVIQTPAVYYRLAEDATIKEHYFSDYEVDSKDDKGNYNGDVATSGTILRNYEIQNYTATIKWNDVDKISGDRPTKEEWLSDNTITIERILYKENANGTVEKIVTPVPIKVTNNNEEGEIDVSIDDENNIWTVKLKGYAYDKDNTPYHYCITEKIGDDSGSAIVGLDSTKGEDGNDITDRRYAPRYVNVGNSANIEDGLFDGGTLYNVLAGNTVFKIKKQWIDEATKDIIEHRPTPSIIVSSYKKDVDYGWRHTYATQDAKYEPITNQIGKEEDGTLNKLYEYSCSGYNGTLFDAYDGDGAELIYVGKEHMEKNSDSNNYVQKRITKEGVEEELIDRVFIKNGETLVNQIKEQVYVKATKKWNASAAQGADMRVTLALYKTTVDPEPYKDKDFSEYEKIASASKIERSEKVLEGFSAEVTSKSITWDKLDKFAEDGTRLYYFAKEEIVEFKAGEKYERAVDDEGSNGKKYFVTSDGHRYIQSVKLETNQHGDAHTIITNTLVGNAQVKLIKIFPDGLSETDINNLLHGQKEFTFSFDVFRDKEKLGTITRSFGTTDGAIKTIHKYDRDTNTVLDETISISEDLHELRQAFADVVIIEKYTDDIVLSDKFKKYIDSIPEEERNKYLLPRYSDDGVEYTYSIFEHEEDGRGYYPTMLNNYEIKPYEDSNKDVVIPYIGTRDNGTDKYRLDYVTITNGTNKTDYAWVYKEWLDGNDVESREAVTFILQKRTESGWVDVEGSEQTIDPAAQVSYKYICFKIPDEVKTDFNNWRNSGYPETDGSVPFRIIEKTLGGANVEYYQGKNKTINNNFTEEAYLGHDWNQYHGDKDEFKKRIDSNEENDDYGFVQGKTYDYDVLIIDSKTAHIDKNTNEKKATSSYIDYQYYEEANVIGNRNFDFALSNVRVGYYYVDISKTWKDGEDGKEEKDYKYRPNKIILKLKAGDETREVELNAANNWKEHVGPFRKFNDEGELNSSVELVWISNAIEYKENEVRVGNGYEVLVYNKERDENAKKFYDAYKMNYNITPADEKDHHRGDVYTIDITNELSGTVTPVVNKFWEDYDDIVNKRPKISTNLYVKYNDGSDHFIQLDDDTHGFFDFEWETSLDVKANNWWQVTYTSLPRFDSQKGYCELTYYIGESFGSVNRNDYEEIGAFEGSPTCLTNKPATYTYKASESNIEKVTEGAKKDEKVHVVEVKPNGVPGTIVNSPRSMRTVSGVKVYGDIPTNYSTKFLPDVKVELWRVPYGVKISDDEQIRKNTDGAKKVHQYNNGLDALGKPALVEDSNKYLYTVLKGANEIKERKFDFYNRDDSGNVTDELAQVPKYDDSGRPYTYYIEEVVEGDTEEEINKNKDILDHVYDFTVHHEDTLTNGIKATNAYRDEKNYDITFYKKWTGFDELKEKYNYLDDELDPPEIKIRLYRYLTDKSGNIIEGSGELLTPTAYDMSGDVIVNHSDNDWGKNKNNTYNFITKKNADNSISLRYDKNHKEYTSVTWKNLEYYAPNLNPYKYVVSELIESDRYDRTYQGIYDAKLENNSVVSTGSNIYDKDKSAFDETTAESGKTTPFSDRRKVKHDTDWTGYEVEVNGTYTIDTSKEAKSDKTKDKSSGSGTAAIVNVFTPVFASITIKKLWEYDQFEKDSKGNYLPKKINKGNDGTEYVFEGINVLPVKDEIEFELYRIRNQGSFKPSNGKTTDDKLYKPYLDETGKEVKLKSTDATYIGTYKVKADEWTTTIDDLLVFEPRGYWYRYYVKEVVPDTEQWSYVPYIVETKDDIFWNGGVKETRVGNDQIDGVFELRDIYKDQNSTEVKYSGNPVVTGRKNIFKTVSLEVNKKLKYSAIENDEANNISTKDALALYNLGIIPKYINYKVYYQIEGPEDDGWKLLKKNSNSITITLEFDTKSKAYIKKSVDGLPAYSYEVIEKDGEKKGVYKKVNYCAVEYSVKYKDGTEVKDTSIKENNTDEVKDTLSNTTVKSRDGFSNFSKVTSETKCDAGTEKYPYIYRTTVNNYLDLTSLSVTKEWIDEVGTFGEKIQSISFALQRRIKDDNSSSWENVDNVEEKTIERGSLTQVAIFDNLPLKDKATGKEYEYRAIETKIILKDGDKFVTISVDEANASIGKQGNQKGGTNAYEYISENTTDNTPTGKYIKSFSTKFTNRLRLGSIKVFKKWPNDNYNEFKTRPTNSDKYPEIRVKLTASSLGGISLSDIFKNFNTDFVLELNEGNKWQNSWDNLPLYDVFDNEIKYTITEYALVNGEEKIIGSYDATNEVQLNEKTVSTNGRTTGDVPLADNKTTVVTTENDVAKFETQDSKISTNVTFTNTLATTSYLVKKYWDVDYGTDPSNADADVEKEVNVALQRYHAGAWEDVLTYTADHPEGQKVTAVLEYNPKPELSFKHEWKNLPAKDEDGEDFKYRAVEESIVLKLKNATSSTLPETVTRKDVIVNGKPETTGVVETGAVKGYNYEASVSEIETILSNKLKKGNFSITKKWDDDNDRDGLRPDSVIFHLQRKLETDAKYKWVTLPKAFDREIKKQTDGSWTTAEWEGLPVVNAFGESYSYRVYETDTEGRDISEYVLRRYVDDSNFSVLDRLIDAIKKITENIRKFVYELLTGLEYTVEYYDEGTVLEEGKTVEVTYVNIHDLETVDVEVSKEWIDQNDKYGERPEELAVALYAEYLDPETNATVSEIVKKFELADGQEVELDNPVILNKGNEWKATWSNLPKYKRGFSGKENRKAITYVVKEGTISTEAGSDKTTFIESEVNGYTRTKSDTKRKEMTSNSVNYVKYVTELENKVATTSFIVNKYWDEEKDITKANEDYERYVNIALEYSKDEGEHWKPVINHNDDDGNYVASGSEVTAVLEESNDYSYEWNDLPVSGSKGEKLFYRAVEKSIMTVDKKTGKGKEVKLDGNVVGAYNYDFDSKEFNDDHIWIASLSNILKKGEFSVTKVWEDDDDRDGKRPDRILFHLERKLESDNDENWTTLPDDFDREITKQTELESGEWSIATWSQLPLKAPNGVSYIYRAVEDEKKAELASRGYKFVAADGVKLEEETLVRSTCSNIHKPGTVDVTVTKKWEDNENKYGDRPEKIKVSLWAYYFDKNNNRVDKPVSQMMIEDDLADNQKFDDVTLTADKNWTVTWKDLPEYKRGEIGKELSYYVVEDDFSDSNETNDNIRIRDGIVVDDNMEYDNKVDGYTHISEDDIVNVTTDASGKKIFEITITNTQDTKEIVVRKNWENEYSGFGKIVVGAEVVLQRKTENMNDWENVTEVGNDNPTLYVIRKPETSISIKDLPACDAKGIPYLYRAVETRIILSDGSSINTDATKADPTKGHTGSYVYSSESTETETGFRTDITNRMDTASLKVSKIWDDSNDSKQKRPKTLKITLKTSTVDKNGTTTDIEVPGLKTETVLNAANNWTDDTTWASVPVFTLDGKQIYYTFTEESITDYKASYKSVTYGLEARTGSGETAARVYAVSGQVSEVTFTNSYSGGGNNGGGGGGGGGGNTPGGRDNPSDSTDDGEVLGANREIPEEPEVLGATRRPQTGDNSNMMLYGIGAIISMAVLAAWFYANKKRKKASA